jgi:putative membrane protein
LLSGFFGISALLLSLNEKNIIPEQKITDSITIPKKGLFKSIIGATVSGSLTGIFPGLGPAQAAIIALQFLGHMSAHSFLILLGGISTVNFIFSLATFYAINKARNGAVVAIGEFIPSLSRNDLILLLAVALIVAGISTYIALWCSKVFAKNITKINYQKLVTSVICIIVLLTLFFSGWKGLLILATSTAIGLIAPLVGVKRSHAMGCLLLPVIFFYLI